MIVQVERADDPRIRDYALVADSRALQATGRFVAEGRLLVERLIASTRFPLHSVLLTPTALRNLRGAADLGQPVFVAAASVLEGITGINFHRGCLALGHRSITGHSRNTGGHSRNTGGHSRNTGGHRSNTEHRSNTDRGTEETQILQGRTLLALEGVGNPDNVGGLFRVAAAFGVSGVLLDAASGDPLYRKALRTSMGAVLTLPFARAASWPGALGEYRKRGFRIVALTPDPGAPALRNVPQEPARATLVLVGGEGQGLSDEALALADVRARIPMAPGIDSLNVTVAAGIALAGLSKDL